MSEVGKLYIVATPIGNLEDITLRAITVLKDVQLIAAEDTRQSKKLLSHFGINTPLYSLHAHNERTHSAKILELLSNNQNVAYITDAGTPLISDPGAYLVKVVRQQGYKVVPVPGPSALITALSAAGFTSPHFYFEGFLPNKQSSRKQRLAKLKHLDCTLIFYESPHRILNALSDILEVMGNREVVLARELTKKYETISVGLVSDLLEFLVDSTEQRLGEFVVLLSGNPEQESMAPQKITAVLETLLKDLPVKQAVAVASKLLDINKNDLYDLALDIKKAL